MVRTTLVFIFATSMEADPFINLVKGEQIAREPWSVYQAVLAGQPTLIIISGMGMESAKNMMEFIVENYATDIIINCGIAGSLNKKFILGDIINIRQSRVYKNNRVDEEACDIEKHPFTLTGYPEGVLLTVDHPVFDLDKKKQLSELAQLVDMEGAVIAKVCKENNLAVQLIKIISDVAEDRCQLKMNLFDMSKILANRLVNDIHKLFHQEITI